MYAKTVLIRATLRAIHSLELGLTQDAATILGLTQDAANILGLTQDATNILVNNTTK